MCFEMGFQNVGLELKSSCLSLPSAGIIGVHHRTWLPSVLKTGIINDLSYYSAPQKTNKGK
jgi:hypothetical protein